MSVEFPNEAARCQRFLSGRAQSSFEPRSGNGPLISAATDRGTCPIHNIQKERAGSHAQVGQPVREAAPVPPAQVIVDLDPAPIVKQVTVATTQNPGLRYRPRRR
jgi:hypothetical protein